MAFQTNLKKLERLLSLMDEDSLTKEDFVKAFKSVVDILNTKFSDIRQANAQEMAQLRSLLEKANKEKGDALSSGVTTTMTDAVSKLNVARQKLETEQKATMDLIRDKLRAFREFTEEDKQDITDEVREALVDMIPEIPELQIPTEITDSLQQIMAEHEKQRKDIEELKERPIGRVGGGGHTDIGVQASMGRIVKTETPSGAIDGANTDYTLQGTPHAVLAFHINGQAIPSADYSVSGKTITFSTALPSALSGTEFEIVYI